MHHLLKSFVHRHVLLTQRLVAVVVTHQVVQTRLLPAGGSGGGDGDDDCGGDGGNDCGGGSNGSNGGDDGGCGSDGGDCGDENNKTVESDKSSFNIKHNLIEKK